MSREYLTKTSEDAYNFDMVATLKPRHQRFVEAYLKCNDAGDAYLAAGYKAKTKEIASACARKLLKIALIEQELARRQSQRAVKADVDAVKVLREFARVAFSDPRKMFNENGSLKPMHELDDDIAMAISSVEVSEEFAGRGEHRHLIGYTKKIRLWSKVEALKSLAQHLNLLGTGDKSEGNTIINFQVVERIVMERQKPIQIERPQFAERVISGPRTADDQKCAADGGHLSATG